MIMVMIIINDDDNNESNDNDDDDDNSDENDDNSDDNVNNNATWLTCEIQGMVDLHDNSYKMPCHESICAEVHNYFIPLSSVNHILKHDTKIFSSGNATSQRNKSNQQIEKMRIKIFISKACRGKIFKRKKTRQERMKM